MESIPENKAHEDLELEDHIRYLIDRLKGLDYDNDDRVIVINQIKTLSTKLEEEIGELKEDISAKPEGEKGNSGFWEAGKQKITNLEKVLGEANKVLE